jgi:hypothetical protein
MDSLESVGSSPVVAEDTPSGRKLPPSSTQRSASIRAWARIASWRTIKSATRWLIVALLDPMKPALARRNLVVCRSQQRERTQLTRCSLRAFVFVV